MTRRTIRATLLSALTSLLLTTGLQAQSYALPPEVQDGASAILARSIPRRLSTARPMVEKATLHGSTLSIYFNVNATNIPFRTAMVHNIQKEMEELVRSNHINADRLRIMVDGKPIEELIPKAFGGAQQRPAMGQMYEKLKSEPLVREATPLIRPTKGLYGHHLAVWQSHGYFYDYKQTKWRWQRPALFGTVEDLFTQSYILPYIVPMLEKSGAVVLLPRERDTSLREYIIDNDPSDYTRGSVSFTKGKSSAWSTAGAGFGYKKALLHEGDNPFAMGTALQTKGAKSRSGEMMWMAKIDESGTYAVYVSYKTLPNSVSDAHYRVQHAGGVSTFLVNQRMGGGTWIYLGTFPFDKNLKDQGVLLTNETTATNGVVTADAVKIGGGMGNIARAFEGKLYEGRGRHRKAYRQTPILSGAPRYFEGARYFLQWAGAPDSVYTGRAGKNDYIDDYRSRGVWVNYLIGRTPANPKSNGLGIPIDMSFALHSDAGERPRDSIFGTLAIYNTFWNNGYYAGGLPRAAARDLADVVQSYVVRDIRATHAPEWMRRGMWNKDYSEATLQEVPGLLLEFLSHQNEADMRYGLDPAFRFTVSRAIYKGILRFVTNEYHTQFVVQPLPVKQLAVHIEPTGEATLTWVPEEDPLEPTATPDRFIVYTAKGGIDAPFDNGKVVTTTTYRVSLNPGELYRFKVVAANEGGSSFPSEIVAAGIPTEVKGSAIVVNGFDKVSAPDPMRRTKGIPYIEDIASIPTYFSEGNKIPGNTFDYLGKHATALMKSGFAVATASRRFIEEHPDELKKYDVMDLMLGLQKSYIQGKTTGKAPLFSWMSRDLQFALESYTLTGGKVIVSGAYLSTDIVAPAKALRVNEDLDFANEVLHYAPGVRNASTLGEVQVVPDNALYGLQAESYTIVNRLNPQKNRMGADEVDAIVPTNGAVPFLNYGQTDLAAGIFFERPFRGCVLGFPIEALSNQSQIDALIAQIIAFLTHQSR